MKIKPAPLPVAMIVFCMLLLVYPSWSQAEGDSFSPANTLLFLTDHLNNAPTDTPLVYGIDQNGTEETWFKDTITLELKAIDGGHKEAQTVFMTGEHYRWTPPITDPTGNPVIMLFLQSDINEMVGINGGQWRHYQKYIKLALEERATVEDTTFDYAGTPHQGKKIRIKPFVSDPLAGKFKQPAFIQKQYDFTVSDQVPGGLYRIQALVPATDASKKPLFSRELLLQAQK